MLQTKLKKSQCCERTLVEKKNAKINTRSTETHQYLGAENTQRNQKEREIQGNRTKIKKKRLNAILEELKQRLQAKTPKRKKYDQRNESSEINRFFQKGKKRVYQRPNGKVESSERPDTEESRRFWSNIWGTRKSRNKNAKWLKELRLQINGIKQGNIQIITEMVTQQTRKVPNWKCPEPDGV